MLLKIVVIFEVLLLRRVSNSAGESRVDNRSCAGRQPKEQQGTEQRNFVFAPHFKQ